MAIVPINVGQIPDEELTTLRKGAQDINANFADIDTRVRAVVASVASLQTALNGKAAQGDVDAKASQAALDALAASIVAPLTEAQLVNIVNTDGTALRAAIVGLMGSTAPPLDVATAAPEFTGTVLTGLGSTEPVPIPDAPVFTGTVLTQE